MLDLDLSREARADFVTQRTLRPLLKAALSSPEDPPRMRMYATSFINTVCALLLDRSRFSNSLNVAVTNLSTTPPPRSVKGLMRQAPEASGSKSVKRKRDPSSSSNKREIRTYKDEVDEYAFVVLHHTFVPAHIDAGCSQIRPGRASRVDAGGNTPAFRAQEDVDQQACLMRIQVWRRHYAWGHGSTFALASQARPITHCSDCKPACKCFELKLVCCNTMTETAAESACWTVFTAQCLCPMVCCKLRQIATGKAHHRHSQQSLELCSSLQLIAGPTTKWQVLAPALRIGVLFFDQWSAPYFHGDPLAI